MIGGLLKSASHLAIVATAGIFAVGISMSPAQAADLGGDCCADLEERVAELEATTARKGNRKMSLTVSGQVNRAILHWNAPAIAGQPRSGTNFGIDNSISSTRFGLAGSAKVSPTVSAGFSILIDLASGSQTSGITRVNDDPALVNTLGAQQVLADDHGLRMRDANWWLESSQIGRLTVGRLTGSGPVGTIDLGGASVVASSSGLVAAQVTFANGRGLRDAYNRNGDYGFRQDGIKWTSPSLVGFVMSASYGETGRRHTTGNDAACSGNVNTTPAAAAPTNTVNNSCGVDGNIWGVDLRYAGEFSGFRLAAGIGYERSGDDASTPTNVAATNLGGSLALMHIATGLFVQGDYLRFKRGNATNLAPALATSDTGNTWLVQAGIAQNWFGIGRTTLYGEYGTANDTVAVWSATLNGTQSDMRYYGLGIVQAVDAAAMELYAGYRNYNLDEAGVDQGKINTFLAGARVKF